MNTISIKTQTRRASRAFTLIEVAMAVGVAGFCLVTISGLLPLGLSSNQTSLEQTMAGNISSAIVSDLRSAQPAGAVTSPRFGISIPASSATAAAITSGTQTIIYLSANGSVTSVGSSGSAAPVFASRWLWHAVAAQRHAGAGAHQVGPSPTAIRAAGPSTTSAHTRRIRRSTGISNASRKTPGFTLVEMLVSIAVLVILVLLISQLFNSATATATMSRSHIDADEAARQVFDPDG